MGAPKAGGRGPPRYRLKEAEHNAIRFTSSKNKHITTTHIFDISETGVAFVASHRHAPRVGEIIKMDFSPMGTVQIACTGRVVRIEEAVKSSGWAKFPGTVKVGVVFHNLPQLYRKNLTRILDEAMATRARYEQFETERSTNVSRRNPWFIENAGKTLAVILTLLAIFVGGYYFFTFLEDQQPAEKAPWAENFFNKVIPKQK